MNVLLTGGGTGGHVYPALAIAEAVREASPSSRLLFAGSRAGMEAALVPASGVSFAGLAVRPPRGRSLTRMAVALATGAASLAEAMALVVRFRPDVIVATGGIAAAPVVAAGAALRVPVVVLEGNVLPGRINRVLARCSRAVAVAWPEAAAQLPGRRAVVTGLPVRREVRAAAREDGLRCFGLDPARRTVLVLGGSQGAAALNHAVEDAVADFAGRPDVQVLHQVGRGWAAAATPPEEPLHGTREAPARPNPDVRGTGSPEPVESAGPEGRETRDVGGVRYVRTAYLSRIGAAYACADLVVSRCGATALAEITACGLPAILVPYRHAAEDHQARNAAPLAAAGAAVIVPDAALDGGALAREIADVLDRPGRLAAMAARARALGRPDAASRVLELLEDVVRRPAAREVRG